MWERPVRDKHFGLFDLFVNYGCNKFQKTNIRFETIEIEKDVNVVHHLLDIKPDIAWRQDLDFFFAKL
jgi:hypothetical protein